MPRRRREGTTRGQRGASLVEFALIVPLLSMFLFGIVQFGIAYDKKQNINSAAREGARAAAIPINDVQDVIDVVESSFVGLVDSDPLDVTVEVNGVAYVGTERPCDGNEGDTVIVTAQVDHVLTIPFFGAPEITLTGEGEFRCERD